MEKIIHENLVGNCGLVDFDMKDIMEALSGADSIDIIYADSKDMKKAISKIKPLRDAKGILIKVFFPKKAEKMQVK